MKPTTGPTADRASRIQTTVTEMAIKAQERRARRLMLQGKLDGAMSAYQEILHLAPDNATAYYRLGLCHRQRRQWAEAARAFGKALDLGDERAEPLLAESQAVLAGDATSTAAEPPTAREGMDETAPAVVVGGQVLTSSPVAQHGDGTAEVGDRSDKPRGPCRLEDRSSLGGMDVATADRPIHCPPITQVFDPEGPLAQALGAHYRPRTGQVQMAVLVREALQARRHAVLEAGTGIGKSFAYLVPVLWSGTSAVISTSNKGLMNQLWEKDIPRLLRVAPQPVTTALLKGRSNYVCALRLDRMKNIGGLPGLEPEPDLTAEALEKEPSGDMELMRLPSRLAARLSVSSRECHGHRCDHFSGCFYEKAKREAIQADLVVTNHALLCHNALLAENHILPVRPVLIIDEAHQLPRYAVDALTLALGQDQFWGLINLPQVREAVEDQELLDELSTSYEVFYRALARQRPGQSHDARRPTRWALVGELQDGLALWAALQQLQRALAHTRSLAEGDRDAILMQAEAVTATVDVLARPEPETHIRLCELEEKVMSDGADAYHASYRPLEVADPLQRLLFETWPRVICTSATLGVGKDLGWFQRQVGLPRIGAEVIAATLPGPFDYGRQMLLYTPRSLVPVYDAARQAFAGGYIAQLTEEVQRLLEASRGRALVLCTSYARMHQLYDALAPTLQPRYPCYRQGETAQPELVTRFRQAGNAILFATRGFWEGLDIPGEALALVILDKIPFVPYDDPIIRRQEARIQARGGNAFYELQIGPAILNLRQGAGRLIRTETDRGVIALLDGRVLRKTYGRQIIQSLPEGCHTTDFTDVADFLRT